MGAAGRPKEALRAPRSAPETPQSVLNPLKNGPKLPPIQFLSESLPFIFLLESCIDFSLFFHQCFRNFQSLKPLILLIFPWENAVFYRITIFQKKCDKSAKKPSQSPPKPFPEPSQNEQKSKNLVQTTYDILRCVQKRPRSVQHAPQKRPRAPQEIPRKAQWPMEGIDNPSGLLLFGVWPSPKDQRSLKT